MFTMLLTGLLAVAPVAPGHATVPPRPVTTSSTFAKAADPAAKLLEQARAAQARGDLDTALREFGRAARLQRAEGIMPVEASYGAAHVLSELSRHRDAADVLEALAADANLLGDADTEARVLLDVVAIKVGHHRRAAARPNAERLKMLITDVRVTSDTRRLIKARLT